MWFTKKNKKTSPEERRAINNTFIKGLGITCYEQLPVIERTEKIKDIDTICKRAIACLLSIQLACDINQDDDVEEATEFFKGLLERYGVWDELYDNEKKLFTGDYTKQDAINIVWTYEAYWALVWVLGLIDDIKMSDDICDCEKAIALLSEKADYNEFKKTCRLRSIEEILDMTDLYFRYHWACVEKRLKPETQTGNLNSDVVIERRKALEWVISDEYDWNYIALNT